MTTDSQKSRKIKVMIVEDVEVTLALERRILEKAGFEVICVSSGEQALAESFNHKPDIVVVDILLPSMTGFDLIRKFKEEKEFHKIPFIVVTNCDSEADQVKACLLGVHTYLIKSEFTAEDFLSAVNSLIPS